MRRCPAAGRRFSARCSARCIIQLVRYTLLANGVPDAVALIVKAAIIVVAVYLQQAGALAMDRISTSASSTSAAS